MKLLNVISAAPQSYFKGVDTEDNFSGAVVELNDFETNESPDILIGLSYNTEEHEFSNIGTVQNVMDRIRNILETSSVITRITEDMFSGPTDEVASMFRNDYKQLASIYSGFSNPGDSKKWFWGFGVTLARKLNKVVVTNLVTNIHKVSWHTMPYGIIGHSIPSIPIITAAQNLSVFHVIPIQYIMAESGNMNCSFDVISNFIHEKNSKINENESGQNVWFSKIKEINEIKVDAAKIISKWGFVEKRYTLQMNMTTNKNRSVAINDEYGALVGQTLRDNPDGYLRILTSFDNGLFVSCRLHNLCYTSDKENLLSLQPVVIKVNEDDSYETFKQAIKDIASILIESGISKETLAENMEDNEKCTKIIEEMKKIEQKHNYNN